MARYPYYMPRVDYDSFNTTLSYPVATTPQQRVRAKIEQWRNILKNGDGLGNAWNGALPASYKVSDIAEFTRSTYTSYCFVVRDTSNNAEWLIIMSGYGTTYNEDINSAAVGGFSYCAQYAQLVSASPDNSGGVSGSEAGFAVYFNPDYATDTFDMAFDDAVNLTYTGGDYTNTTPNLPADNTTKANAFMPATDYPRGAMFFSSIVDEQFFLFDNAEPFLAVYQDAGCVGTPRRIAILGDVFKTALGAGDTYTQGTVWIEPNYTGYLDPVSGEGYADGFDQAGTREHDFNLGPRKTFTPANEDDGGGDLLWLPLEVLNTGTFKGWIKDSIMREIGAYNWPGHYRAAFEGPDAARPLVKYSNALAFPYCENVPVFPFAYKGKL